MVDSGIYFADFKSNIGMLKYTALELMLFQFATPIYFLGVIFSIVLAVFFFWRAAAIELYSNEEIFDVLGIGALGGLLAGRLSAFFIEFDRFKFSFDRLIFFHVFPGFNFYGFVLGAFLTVAYLAKRRRQKPWKFFDIAAAPAILGLTFFYGFRAFYLWLVTQKYDFWTLFNFAIFFVLLFVIKRLEARKRHDGFFACFYLVWVPVVDIANFVVSHIGRSLSAVDLYPLVMPVSFLVFGITLWYRLSPRVLLNDVKGAFAYLLLKVMATIRVFRSLDEAGRFSKLLILAPYTTGARILVLLRGLFRELKLGMLEFFHSLGLFR